MNKMTQRERLIELLCDFYYSDNVCTNCEHNLETDYVCNQCITEHEVDHLLANGVVVLPCKVGDTVYQIGRDFCNKRNHDKCDNYCDGWDDLCPENNGELEIQTRVFTVGLFDLVGKSIYLTREEAEKALAERKGGDYCDEE